MELYLRLAGSSGDCKSQDHIQELYKCALPPIDYDSDTTYEAHEKRTDEMFFSKDKLRQYFKMPKVILDLLSCECRQCTASQEKLTELDKQPFQNIIKTSKDGPLFLALMVYLGKLHYVYSWLTSDFTDLELRLAESRLANRLVAQFLSDRRQANLFLRAWAQTIEMFDPVVLEFTRKTHYPHKEYEGIQRFPFRERQKRDIQQGSFGGMEIFEIQPEYCHRSIEEHMSEYPSFTRGHGSDKKLLFASKSVKQEPDGLFRTERDMLRMVSEIEKPAANNIVTLLTCYSWREHIYFIFPYIESDLKRLLRSETPQRISVQTNEPLPKNSLWKQMIGVAEALMVIHRGMKDLFKEITGRVVAFHFDLKPANILVTADGKLKIADFGQSHIELVNQDGKIERMYNQGDPRYAAPELQPTAEPAQLLDGDVEAMLNYDVWSLACIMTEVLIYLLHSPEDSGDERALDKLDQGLSSGSMGGRFFDENKRLKDCVRVAIEATRTKFRNDGAHHEYLADLTSLLLGMFHSDNCKRTSSEKVAERLREAEVRYDRVRASQDDELASVLMGPDVPEEFGCRELGWTSPSGSTVSFAKMDNIKVEVVTRATGVAWYSGEPCRIRLFQPPREPRGNKFVLAWAVKHPWYGQQPRKHERTIEFPGWCLKPSYLFQEKPREGNKFDCVLFPDSDSFEGLAIILTFQSKEDLYAFQGTLLRKKILPSYEFSQASITLKWKDGWRWKKAEPTRATVQFWAKDSPKLLDDDGSHRDPAPSDPQMETMVIFQRGETILEVPLNNSQKIFRHATKSGIAEVRPDRSLGHKYFEGFRPSSSPPWNTGSIGERNSATFETPDIRPKVSEREGRGRLKITSMDIVVESDKDLWTALDDAAKAGSGRAEGRLLDKSADIKSADKDAVRDAPAEGKPVESSDLVDLVEPTQAAGSSEMSSLAELAVQHDDLRSWQKRVNSDLPDAIRDSLEYCEVFGSGPVWTCTPSKDTPMEEIPLTIGGHQVVIPAKYYYPAAAFTMPPPDPHPHFIDPSVEIDEATVKDIFEIFEGVLGFHLLINGMLQLIVPDDFDLEYALSHRPNKFGGARISYIPEAMIPTADRREGGPSSTSVEQRLSIGPSETRQRSDLDQPKSSSQSPTQPHMANSAGKGSTRRLAHNGPIDLEIGSMVQARVSGAKGTERFQGKIGLMTEANDRNYLAVSSHMLTQALAAAKSDRFPGQDWIGSVGVVASNGCQELGPVAETFDPDARTFPHGFLHDISLVDVTSTPRHLVAGVASPIPTEWLSQSGWSKIKYTSQNLFMLDSPDVRARSIGLLGSQCQMVGQAILKLREQSEKRTWFRLPFVGAKSGSTTNLETWTGLVSRSLLYRVDAALRVPGSQSGTAVCIHEGAGDKVSCAKVAGFSSWAQPVSDITRFDMDDKKLYNRLEEGRMAYYGAFQAPLKLREEYRIV